jgi:hypothetical protein
MLKPTSGDKWSISVGARINGFMPVVLRII